MLNTYHWFFSRLKYSVPLKYFSSNLHLQNMSAQKNLRKTWKVSWQSTKKVFYKKNPKQDKTFWLRVLYTALYCWITWRGSYLAKYHWSSLDPQKITEAFTQRAHSEWEKWKFCIIHWRLTQTVTGLNSCITMMYEMLPTMRSGTRLKNTKYKEVNFKTLWVLSRSQLVSMTEKTKTNRDKVEWRNLLLTKWRLRWNMIVFYK